MKKRICSILTSLIWVISFLGAVPSISVRAEEFGDFTYQILDNGTIEIINYNGSDESVTIPSKINGIVVTRIGEMAFENCFTIKEVIIPNTITSIGFKAFQSCFNIKNINIPSSVRTIENEAFLDCTNITIFSIPKTVTKIGNCAIGYYSKDFGDYIDWNKIENFKINCYSGSTGEKYAKINGFKYVVVDSNPENVTGFKSAATSNTKVKLTWNKAGGAQGYIVYKYDASKKAWTRIAKTTTTSNTYIVTGLKAGTTYKFAVKAYKTVNRKEISSEKYPTVTTTTMPSTVNFKLKAYPNKVTVSWSKVPGASGYIVYYKTSANGKWQRLKLTIGTSYTKTGLKKSRDYWFTVRAYRTVSGKHYYGTFATKSIKTDYCYSTKKSSVEKKAASILDRIAKQNNIDTPTLYMAYNWSKMQYVKNKTNPNLGTEWFSDIGLTYHKGNCYVMAATFTEFAKLLGYNAVQISGDVPLRIGGNGPHSWVEIIINNTVYVCDPDLEYEFGTNHYMFKYHPVSSGSSYYIVGDGKHVKYHRIRTMK